MSSVHHAYERANLLLPEILSHDHYDKIRHFYLQSSGDQNPRTLSYMLTDRLTFGFVIGMLSDHEVASQLISALNFGQQEMRNRIYDRAAKTTKQIELPSALSGLNISL